MSRRIGFALAGLAYVLCASGDARGQIGTAFTYQGSLEELGAAVTGNFDFRFGLWDAPAAGTQAGAAIDYDAGGLGTVEVEDGLFSVELDFGPGIFTGDPLWLEISVRTEDPADLAPYTLMDPRVALLPVPYSIRAASAGMADLATDVINDAVDDADPDPGNEIQDLTLAADLLGLTGSAVSVNLTPYLDNTDDQNLFSVLSSGNNAGGADAVNFGSIGVGVSAPDQTLDISGSMLLSANGVAGFIHNGANMALSSDGNILVVADSNDTAGATASDIILGAGSAIDTDLDRAFTFSEAYPTVTPRNEFMRIVGSSGFVGIGFPAPTHRLHVTSDSTNLAGVYESASTIGTWLNLRNTSADGRYWRLISSGSGNGEGAGKLLIGHGTAAHLHSGLLTLDNTNRVGILASSPENRLHVSGGSDASLGGGGYLQLGNAAGSNLVFDDNEIMARSNGATSTLFLNNDGGDLRVGTTLHADSANGRVGVGIINPSAKLHLGGTPGVDGIRFPDGTLQTTAGNPADEIQDLASVLAQGDDAGGSEAVGLGRVGIGTSSPAYPLHISGGGFVVVDRGSVTSSQSSGYVMGGARSSGSIEIGGIWFQNYDEDGALLADYYSARISSFNATGTDSGDLRFFTNDGTGGEVAHRMRITEEGNVGIGLTSPDSLLHLSRASEASVAGGGVLQINPTAVQNLVLDGDEIQSRFNSGVSALRLNEEGGPVHIGTAASGVTGTDNVNIGPGSAGGAKLNVADAVDGNSVSAADHVAYFQNTETASTTNGPDGIMIRIAAPTPGSLSNFVTFIGGALAYGAIEGNGVNGVVFKTTGVDFAEELPRLDFDEEISAGDVVGVFGGKVTKKTDGADWVMAVSTAPAFLGGSSDEYDGDDPRNPGEKIAFVGQVPVRVIGPVSIGDYIVASGAQDGTAKAVAPSVLTAESGGSILGRAWDASDEPGEKLVNTVVGLPETSSTAAALVRRLDEQQTRISHQERLIGAQRADIDRLRAEVDSLRAMRAELTALGRHMETCGSGSSVADALGAR